MARPTRSEAKLERLSTARSAYDRADACDDGSLEAARACIRAQNVLIDACVDCGMAPDACEFEFSARVIANWLRRAA